MKFYQKFIKGGYFIYYYLIILLGIAGFVLSWFRKEFIFSAVAIVPVALIILIAGGMRYMEHRYFVPSYPFFVLFGAYGLERTMSFFFQRKTMSNIDQV